MHLGVGWTDLADGPSRRTAMLIPNGMILKAEVDASDVGFYSEGALKGVPSVYARHDFASEKQLALQAADKSREPKHTCGREHTHYSVDVRYRSKRRINGSPHAARVGNIRKKSEGRARLRFHVGECGPHKFGLVRHRALGRADF